MKKINLYFKMLRVNQWIKNLLVFIPVFIFPSEIDVKTLYALFITFALFCCSASFIYIINDWTDRKLDAQNKFKKYRPFANNDLFLKDGLIGFLFLFVVFIYLFSEIYKISPEVCILVIAYLIQSLLYNFVLKNISLIEIFIVSTGYSYRFAAGGLSIYLLPSMWILITIFLASLFIVAQKRLADRTGVENEVMLRSSIKAYSNKFLNLLTIISSISAIISYILFTLSSYAQLRFQNPYLPISSIFIIYSTFRYLHISTVSTKAHDPINLIISDNRLRICIAFYFLFVIFTNTL